MKMREREKKKERRERKGQREGGVLCDRSLSQSAPGIPLSTEIGSGMST